MTEKKSDKTRVRRFVRETFGCDSLRPGQDAAIKAVLDGHDTLAIMPTGWGKSIIYQAASLLLHEPRVIVSPLIALQRDQVATLEELDVGEAALLNSTLGAPERREAMEDLQQGKLTFLFLAPEQFADQVEQVAITVQKQQQPSDPRDLRAEVGLSQTKMMQVLTYLAENCVLEILPTGEVVPGQKPFDLNEIVEEAMRLQGQHRQFERSRIAMMHGYAELTDCRREYLLNYFGEEMNDPCGFCDNCDAGLSVEEDEENVPFPINTRVVHELWGEGMVLRYEGDKMVVLFDEVGYKTLAVELVIEKILLERLR